MSVTAFHFTLFWITYRGHAYLAGMHSGPRFGSGHGLAAFLRLWARHLAHGHHFAGSAAGVLSKLSEEPVRLRLLRSFARNGHHFERWGAFIGHHLIHRTLIWLGRQS